MPVWFAYRSFDHGPTGKHLKRFEDDTILDWFRRNWDYLAVEDPGVGDARLAEVQGCQAGFLWSPFQMAAAAGRPRPRSHKGLIRLLGEYLELHSHSPHDLQVWTEDDGEGGAIFLFDGHFLKERPGFADYLLHADWRLPSGAGDGPFTPAVETIAQEPGGGGPGTTYIAFLIRESKYPLDDLPVGYRIDGVRLPDLPRHLLANAPKTEEWTGLFRRLIPLLIAGVEAADPLERQFLRAIQSQPADAATWVAWNDWREDRGAEPPGVDLLRRAFARIARLPGRLHDRLPTTTDIKAACRQLLQLEDGHRDQLRAAPRSLIHVEPHLAQVCLDVSWTDDPYFDQWIFFDDLWASAHPDLANAILRFAERWYVLSPD